MRDKLEESEKENIVEALLFIAGKFMSPDELASKSELSAEEVEQVLGRLVEKYSNSGALHIVQHERNYKMDVKPDYIYLINKLVAGETEFSKAEKETLAIIAFKQPIKQSDIVAIRGNKSYSHVKKFIDIGLLNGRKYGKTLVLNLSENFYNYFSISKDNIKRIEK